MYRASEQSNRPNNNAAGTGGNTNTDRRASVGDKVKVIRGRNQGVKETAAQFELKSEFVQGNFRKWKNNVKKVMNPRK